MDTTTKILDFIALAIQLLGTWIMFKNSPVNKPEGVVYLRQTGEIDLNAPKKKNSSLKRGFLTLLIGFIIAFISLVLKNFI